MSGYPSKSILKAPLVVGEEETSLVVATFGVSGQGSRSLRVNFKVSDVTVADGITLSLMQDIAGTKVALASTNASVAVTADGVVSIRLDAAKSADQVDMPLSNQLDVVVTTGTGDAVTIDRIDILQAS
jgi:hypothetical protein